MRKLSFILLLLAAVGLFAEEKSRPRAALDAWIESFNTHDVAARKQFLQENTKLPQEKIDQFSEIDVRLRGQHGKVEVVKVVSATDNTLTAELRHADSGTMATVEVVLETAAPYKIEVVRLSGKKQ